MGFEPEGKTSVVLIRSLVYTAEGSSARCASPRQAAHEWNRDPSSPLARGLKWCLSHRSVM